VAYLSKARGGRGEHPVDPALTTVDLNCAQTMRCRIVTVLEEGTIQVVPEHPVTTAAVHNSPTSS